MSWQCGLDWPSMAVGAMLGGIVMFVLLMLVDSMRSRP